MGSRRTTGGPRRKTASRSAAGSPRRRSTVVRPRTYRSGTRAAPKRTTRRQRKASGQRQSRRLVRVPWARLMAAGVAIGMVVLIVFAFADSRFYVQADRVAIEGARFTDPGEIYRQANLDGYSVFWIARRQASERIEELPFVRRARVQPMLPDGARIQVEERLPVAVWQIGAQLSWVDQEGTLLPMAGQLPDLPALVDAAGMTLDRQGRVDQEIIASVLALQRELPGIVQFAYDRSRGLHFYLQNGTLVSMGQQQGLEQKVQELVALQSALESQDELVTEINLVHEDGYYYRLAP